VRHIRTLFFITLLLCSSQSPAIAEQDTSIGFWDVLPEVIIRPFSLVGTAAGAVFFIAASPFTGLASIPEPHDAFKQNYDDFVVTPFRFTFRRPLGRFDFDIDEKVVE
jgi:hypothetical protein